MNVSASERITLFCFSHTFVILSAVDFDICCICLKLLISEHMHSRDDRGIAEEMLGSNLVILDNGVGHNLSVIKP